MAGFLGYLVRGSFASLRKIITPRLSIMLVALGVAAAVGPPHAASATATDCSQVSGAQGWNWMQVLDPCIRYRRLSDIVIPGSHDSATYGMSLFARTQSVDLYDQLDNGARQLDIRVAWNHNVSPQGWYAAHGSEISNTLSLSGIFDQLARWADAGDAAVNHGQEIILLNLSIPTDAGFPADLCRGLASVVNIVTPKMLYEHFGTKDPGKVTFGQLWSLPKRPGLEHVPRVIMDNTQCIDAAYSGVSQGQWGPFSPAGQTLFSGYYAAQCTAGGFGIVGISPMVNGPTPVHLVINPPAPWRSGGDSRNVGKLYQL